MNLTVQEVTDRESITFTIDYTILNKPMCFRNPVLCIISVAHDLTSLSSLPVITGDLTLVA